ncbi:MAG: nitrilase-related carbon-nitrogen hydrolase [Bacteroidota bacterium]
MAKIRIGGAALNQTPMDWSNNMTNIRTAIDLAKNHRIELLCLPELSLTGYGCEDVFLSEWIYEKSHDLLVEVAAYSKGIAVVVGVPLKHEGLFYNCCAFIDNGRIEGIYAKQNMARDGVHYEPRWFIPWPVHCKKQILIGGQLTPIGDLMIDFKGIKVGFEICEDAWREDRPACRLVKQGVNLIVNPSASHFAFGKTCDREALITSSSRKFNCIYLYANLLGNEAGRMIYDGEILMAKDGQLLQRNKWLSFKNVNVVYADVDTKRESEHYVVNDFRRDKYEEFTQASALALFDYLRKSKAQGFVLSLSGGADSSTIAIMVSEMVKRGIAELGIEAFKQKLGIGKLANCKSDKEVVRKLLTCVYQGTTNSSKETFKSAKNLTSEIGAAFYNWFIDDEVKSYSAKIESALGRNLNWENDDISLQNIQSRGRSPVIWMLANIHHALLLTTSNRSEGDVGYTTMDGDTSGSLAPIAAVDKHFVRDWLRWAEDGLGYTSLRYVNNLQPSAELRPLHNVQTDEDDLMPYHIMVEIEKMAIRDHKSPLEVYLELKMKALADDTLLKSHIKKFFELWSRNQWKRERIAPAFHLDTFNVDPRTWCRFPILSSGFEQELADLDKA